jgi:hypothetical protein
MQTLRPDEQAIRDRAVALLQPDRFWRWLQYQPDYLPCGFPRSDWSNPLALYLHRQGAPLYVNRVCAYDLRRIVVMLPAPFADFMDELATLEQAPPIHIAVAIDRWQRHVSIGHRAA